MRCACAQKIPNCWQQEQSFVHGISSDKAPKVKSRPKGSFIWMRDDAFRMRKNVSGPCRAHEFLPDMFVLRGGGAPYPKSGESPPHQGVLRRHGTEEQRVTSGGLAESPGDSGGSGPVSESEVASDGLSVVGRQILPRSAVKATRPGNRRRKWVGEGRRRWSESKNVDSRVRFIAWRLKSSQELGILKRLVVMNFSPATVFRAMKDPSHADSNFECYPRSGISSRACVDANRRHRARSFR